MVSDPANMNISFLMENLVMTKVRIKIGVVSDVVCPWCYIGKRRLEKAMQLTSGLYDFEVEYFPFELNPHIPQEGLDHREYLCKKFGSEARFLELSQHVNRIAAREGLHFHPEIQRVSPNTRDAHRLIMLAKEDGKQMEVVEGFFRAYFTDGVDLSRMENLIQIAVDAGLGRAKIAELMTTNTGRLEIEMAEKELRDLGITAVPLFIIDDRYAISGAQAVEAFTKGFEQATVAESHK